MEPIVESVHSALLTLDKPLRRFRIQYEVQSASFLIGYRGLLAFRLSPPGTAQVVNLLNRSFQFVRVKACQ